MKNKKHGFTLIELLAVIVIIGILATISVAVYSSYFEKARNTQRDVTSSDMSAIIRISEASSPFGANYSDLDSDETFGVADPVLVADVNAVLSEQDFTMPDKPSDSCYLYGYKVSDFLIVIGRNDQTGTGEDGFVFGGTTASKAQAQNLTAMNCATPGVTGGTWTDYVWLNLTP